MVGKNGGRRGVWTLAARNAVELQIALEFIRPRIWRRILVPDNYSLADLHNVIQIAMGWHDCHLHCFEIDGVPYTFSEQASDMDMEDESKLLLADLIMTETKHFSYEYDFGDIQTLNLCSRKTTAII